MSDLDLLAEKMGNKFVEALHEATTEETLTKSFKKAISEIAEIVREKGTIEIQVASEILSKHNPDKEYRPYVFVGYATPNPKLNNENLIRFERDYFSVPSRYPHLRFGQALVNHFELPKKLGDYIFYTEDVSLVRDIVWMEVRGTTEPKGLWKE